MTQLIGLGVMGAERVPNPRLHGQPQYLSGTGIWRMCLFVWKALRPALVEEVRQENWWGDIEIFRLSRSRPIYCFYGFRVI